MSEDMLRLWVELHREMYREFAKDIEEEVRKIVERTEYDKRRH